MEQINCYTRERDYKILIGSGAWREISASQERKLLVRDGAVKNPGIPAEAEAVLTEGEAGKTFETVVHLCRKAAHLHFNRKDLFIGLGGGVTTDLTGFAAAIYMRGIDFVSIPTSLLAMVDAGVGGKTAADLPEGKNLIGAFHQPRTVLIDPDFLKTLPQQELSNGFAEVIKTAVIFDEKLFSELEEKGATLLNGADLTGIIRKCIEHKARIVSEDEQEHGCRALLNYGHTFGHAVELLGNFLIPHGSCVAIGMRIAAELNCRLNRWQETEAVRQNSLLKKAGLPVNIPQEMKPEAILRAMYSDKKCDANGLRLILPKEKIGTAEIVSGISETLLLKTLEACYD